MQLMQGPNEQTWRPEPEDLAELVPPLIARDGASFTRVLVRQAGKLVGGPIGTEVAVALYDRLTNNENDAIFRRFLAQRQDAEARSALVDAIRSSIEELQDRNLVNVVRVVHQHGEHLDRQVSNIARKLDQLRDRLDRLRPEDLDIAVDTEDGYLSTFCLWFPLIRRLDRVSLDLMDARLYLTVAPSSRVTFERQISALNDCAQPYRRAVRAVQSAWRRHGDRSFAPHRERRAWRDLFRAASLARELESAPVFAPSAIAVGQPDAETLARAHREMLSDLEERARSLTVRRDHLRLAWMKADLAARLRLEAARRHVAPERERAALQELVQGRILPYFDAILELLEALRRFAESEPPKIEAFRVWADDELTPRIVDAGERALWLYDCSGIELLSMAGRTLSTDRAQRLLEWLDGLSSFQAEVVRDRINRAVNALVTVGEGTSAAEGVQRVARVLAEGATLDDEVAEYRAEALQL